MIRGKEEVKDHVQVLGFGTEKDEIIWGENRASGGEYKPPAAYPHKDAWMPHKECTWTPEETLELEKILGAFSTNMVTGAPEWTIMLRESVFSKIMQIPQNTAIYTSAEGWGVMGEPSPMLESVGIQKPKDTSGSGVWNTVKGKMEINHL